MDDRHFDRKSAEEWINTIESEGGKIREQDIYPLLQKWIWDNDLTNVLDLGCGQGVCSSKMPDHTLYTGVDPSPILLERAKSLYPDRKFIGGSAYKMPVPDQSIDGVFSIALWHLLSDLEKAARELARILRDGGHFLIITAEPNSDVWKKSNDRLFLHTENELCDSWLKYNLKPTSMGAFRSFWYFEGRKI
jgi:ubiquinone/menaquinone biosynthesis C-methylase UbiE